MSRASWRLIRSGAGSPSFNLAADQALLDGDDPRPVLRLYAWRPAALSLGRFQPLEPFLAGAHAAGLAVVRRPTGGGAIHHDDELTFSVVSRPGHDGYPAGIDEAYVCIHAVVREALAGLGVRVEPRGGSAPRSVHPRAATLCFEDTTAHDLVDGQGRKVVGSAQRRTGGRVLHHGSIPLTVPALSPGSGSVGLAAGRAITWDAVAEALVRAFGVQMSADLQSDELSPSERRRADSLTRERYADLARPPG